MIKGLGNYLWPLIVGTTSVATLGGGGYGAFRYFSSSSQRISQISPEESSTTGTLGGSKTPEISADTQKPYSDSKVLDEEKSKPETTEDSSERSNSDGIEEKAGTKEVKEVLPKSFLISSQSDVSSDAEIGSASPDSKNIISEQQAPNILSSSNSLASSDEATENTKSRLEEVKERSYSSAFGEDNPSLTVELVLKGESHSAQKENNKSCKRWVGNEEKDIKNDECEKIFKEKKWEENNSQQPRVWLRSKDKTSIQKAFLKFFPYSNHSQDFLPEKQSWEEVGSNGNLICSFAQEVKNSNSQDLNNFEISCFDKVEK